MFAPKNYREKVILRLEKLCENGGIHSHLLEFLEHHIKDGTLTHTLVTGIVKTAMTKSFNVWSELDDLLSSVVDYALCCEVEIVEGFVCVDFPESFKDGSKPYFNML